MGLQMRAFKNALCLASIPEYDYSGQSYRHCLCQRRGTHKGPHRSWSREWNEGDVESRARIVETLSQGKVDATDFESRQED